MTRAKPKARRMTVERARAVDAVFARAARRRVFGFDSHRPSCGRVLYGRVPPEFDHLAAEGDEVWTRIPDARRGDD